MKTKIFIPSPKRYTNDKQLTDYWGILFISFIFLSSISCFLFANHSDSKKSQNLSANDHKASTVIVDADQSSKS